MWERDGGTSETSQTVGNFQDETRTSPQVKNITVEHNSDAVLSPFHRNLAGLKKIPFWKHLVGGGDYLESALTEGSPLRGKGQ